MSMSKGVTTDVTGGAGRARPHAAAFRPSNRAVVVGVSGLFLLPSALFALSLAPVAGGAVVIGCIATLALVATEGRRSADGFLAAPVDVPRFLLAVGVAAGLFLLGGETHLFFATSDWLVRDAVLADLVRFGFPVSYAVEGTTYLLRAPLGMYVVPAAVGHAFGLAGAHAALLAQNALLLGSILYLMMALGRGWPHLVLIVLFGGLSIVGASLQGILPPGITRDTWRWSLDSWNPFFQYSSSVVQFFWVPNHALPGWWLATLFVLQRRAALSVAMLGASTAALSFWSPLAVLPALPWLAWQGCAAWRPTITAARTWVGLAAAACFAPLAAYMVASSGTIDHGGSAGRPGFGLWYGMFILLQLPALAFLALCRRRVPRELRSLLVVNGLVLLVLPFFRFGPNNDLVMRGSIAPLAVVAFGFGLVLLDLLRLRARAGLVGVAIAAASAPSAAVEAWRAVTTARYGVSDCTLMQAARELDGATLPTNYIAALPAVPRWIIGGPSASAPVEPRPCWPDLPR